ncbi:MAG: acyltransferase [Chitinophagaceae bacterium]|jgi:peptidoglycan/LPS O-acetylase OafA/YrhL|nr:acyltransferase [Chitinophagaceae bacterium]MBK7679031.1 acyltransferase [Chitinophagaceae bacterium]MBK8299624.1 acyltransferase [Chitinophagaceae bacterium]MBK9463675.1 acyltransferase [Chitinophagaceae bacterium]MBK9659205.1 acyltransferase [Chitinophagaceae bacterium]
MNPENPNRLHYPALDGLRGLAILLVVVYHNFGFINVFFFGWLGVDLFFVLSGFLITDILLKTLHQKDYLKKFYMRRVLRIFPLYYLCLILFLLIIPQLNIAFDIKYYTDNQVWLWTYLQNWLYIFKNPDQTNTLNHLWSLAVEEQFYLLWPLVILVIRKPKHLLLFISLLLVAVLGLRLWIWTNQVADLAYFNLYTFTRIDGICIGCMVALLLRINKGFLSRYTSLIVLFFAALNFAFFFINRRYNFSFPYLALAGYTTFAMMFGLLINEAVTGKTKLINFVFNISLLKFFGKISYGFYIFHWPVYILLGPYLFSRVSKFASGSSLQFTVSVIATLAAVGISWLSYQYYEKRFLKLKDKLV